MRCTILVAMCVLLVTSPVSAQEAVPVAVSYSAPSSCPTQGRFVTRLRMHTQRVQLSSAVDALALKVAIVRSNRGFTGTLEVTQHGRPAGTRTFEATDCPDVVWALALTAALSIDPEASLTVTSEDEPNETVGTASEADRGEATTEPTPASSPGANTSESSRSRRGSESEVTGQPLPPALEPAPDDAGKGVLWSIGPVLSASFAFEPKAALGGGLIGALRDTTGRQLLPLELALRLEYLGTRLTRGSDPLTLDWWSAHLLACPLRAVDGFTVLLCGVGQAGLIRAEGVDIEQSAAVSRSFFSLGLGVWARQSVSDHWELSAIADFKVPLVDRAFALGPDLEVISSSRPIGAGITVGAVYGF